MSTPNGIFIEYTDEGTDVFFLERTGIGSSTSKEEHDWGVREQHHIPKDHTLKILLDNVQILLSKGSVVDSDSEDIWFVQHKIIKE